MTQPPRTTAEVFDSHLALRTGHDGEADIAANYAAGEVHDGADTFVLRGGRIVAQTIHYTVARG